MGGILFTNAWTGRYIQAVEWHKYALSPGSCTHRSWVLIVFVFPASWATTTSASRLATPRRQTTISTVNTSSTPKAARSTPPRTLATVYSNPAPATTSPCLGKVLLSLRRALYAPPTPAQIFTAQAGRLGCPFQGPRLSLSARSLAPRLRYLQLLPRRPHLPPLPTAGLAHLKRRLVMLPLDY